LAEPLTPDEVVRHMDTVRELSKPGQALAPGAPTATVNNPRWWIDGDATPSRLRLHTRLIDEARSATPDLHQDKQAIVLAGPPGAGKSTVLKEVLGDHRGEYLVIDADEFKRSLLHQAQADGSYDDFLIPNEIRERQEAGEKFYPLELASLVHEESSYLARALRADAIATGDNIVVDTVLSDTNDALALGRQLESAGYDVEVIDVEVPYEVSEARIRGRWKEAYEAALTGGDGLGGRWVPSEYARGVFDGPDGKSRPEAVAQTLAEQCPAVLRYRVFRTIAEQAAEPRAKPVLEADKTRRVHGAALTDTGSRQKANPSFPQAVGRSPGTPMTVRTLARPEQARGRERD
jgi:chloramphenicol 3-O-phosphotransferase